MTHFPMSHNIVFYTFNFNLIHTRCPRGIQRKNFSEECQAATQLKNPYAMSLSVCNSTVFSFHMCKHLLSKQNQPSSNGSGEYRSSSVVSDRLIVVPIG